MPRRSGPFDAYVRRNRLTSFLRFAVATATVAVGFYVILYRAAPIVAQRPAPPAAAATVPAQPPPQVTVTRRVVNVETHETRTIYRCTVDGETTYSNSPCPQARVVDTRPAVGSYVATPVRRQAPAQPLEAAAAPARTTPASDDAQAKRDAHWS